MAHMTIHDIALRAGVSIGTVSKALNNYKGVNEATRQRILTIAAENGFRANSLARGLATKQSRVIGVFFNDSINSGFVHHYFQRVLQGFKVAVGNAGYDLLFFTNAGFTENRVTNDYLDRARHRSVDGVVLMGMDRFDVGARQIAGSGMPCMSIDMDVTGPRAGYVQSTNVEGARAVVDHLVKLGHREIAFIGDRHQSKPGMDRRLGYEIAMRQHGLATPAEWFGQGDFTRESGRTAMTMLLREGPFPTALVTVGDDLALGAIDAIVERGLKVPEDISVTGFDDIEVAASYRPALTTVRQEMEVIGERAGEALIHLVEEEGYPPPVISVETTLIVRESSGTACK